MVPGLQTGAEDPDSDSKPRLDAEFSFPFRLFTKEAEILQFSEIKRSIHLKDISIFRLLLIRIRISSSQPRPSSKIIQLDLKP